MAVAPQRKKYLSGIVHWRKSPHGAQLRAHIERGLRIPSALVEAGHDRSCEEAALRAVDMPIAHARLLRDVVLEGRDEIEAALRARHRDVEEAPFLLDERRAAGRELGGEAAIADVQHMHRIPFLALRRMHGGEHEIVLVEMRIAREIAGRRRRVERELT